MRGYDELFREKIMSERPDPPYCANCTRGFSKEECDACERMHESLPRCRYFKWTDDDEEYCSCFEEYGCEGFKECECYEPD